MLDQDPTDVALTQDSFNLLKKSNPTRFEILSLMLTAMGITCEHVTQPDLSPCFMLANDQVSIEQKCFRTEVSFSLIMGINQGHYLNLEINYVTIK